MKFLTTNDSRVSVFVLFMVSALLNWFNVYIAGVLPFVFALVWVVLLTPVAIVTGLLLVMVLTGDTFQDVFGNV